MTTNDDVTLKIDGRPYGGWTSVRITRGIERCPADFDIGMTERYPESVDAMQIKPGDPCEVLIGNDRVITGYIDDVTPSITGRQHSIRVAGRGKCQDLVDCSAEWKGYQISGVNVLQMAQKLAEPFGISVTGVGDMGDVIPTFNIMLGETPYEVIERWARVRGLLVYELADGSLRLLQAGTFLGGNNPFPAGASGFAEGINVEHAVANWSMSQRYSVYTTHRMAIDMLLDIGEGGNLIESIPDPGVKRFRPRRIIAEQWDWDMSLNNAKKRAHWEAMRRWGRSGVIKVVTDSWRNVASKLYEPGTSVPIDIPAIHKRSTQGSPTWVIGEVTYTKGPNGTHCEATLMERHAFVMEPVLPQYHIAPEIQKLPDGLARK